MRVIRGGVEFVVTVENLAELAEGFPMVREVRDFDGAPVVVRVSVSGEGRKGLRVEVWGARNIGRVEQQAAKDWEARVRALAASPVNGALPDGAVNSATQRKGPQVRRLPDGRVKIVG